ncbi:chlorophyll a/b-binding protein domain-containing protein [Baffinella frigidus]|nr:chlorophyll a/b-binding protein domain-containing protein [Cryptophyta sp. CCMP2293]
MFSLKLLALTGALAGAAAFAPMGLAPAATRRAGATSSALRMQQDGPKTLIRQTFLTPELFKSIDVDESGTIDLEELKNAVKFSSSADVRALIQRGDLNGDGVIDYPEYERLMNMEVYGDAAGGNFYVRQALDLGLLKPTSPLADCVMVGNKGFDPLGLAKNLVELDTFREAEIKHGRLAMLAAVGWPAAERLNPYFTKAMGAPDLLVAGGKVPSLLNGGLENINPIFFAGVIAFTAFVETEVLNKVKLRENRQPGDLGFDPLGLYKGKSFEEKRSLELKELQNGRLAMIGIVGYVAEEFVTKFSVLTETPVLEKAVEKALGGV